MTKMTNVTAKLVGSTNEMFSCLQIVGSNMQNMIKVSWELKMCKRIKFSLC